MSQEFIFFGQLLLAALLGGLLGSQPGRRGKAAGARTYAFVTIGATLFTILSIHGFGASDSARVAAQIVVGIGFLGAGVIFHRQSHVEGITTAAGLWAAAALGMAVGAGFYILSFAATLILFLLFMFNDDALETWGKK